MKDAAPSRLAYDRGVHVRGTPLWVDPERRRELALLTSLVQKLPPKHARAVASAELAATLHGAGHGGKVLPMPPGRWVGVGGQKVFVVGLPGVPLGGAALVVACGGERLLFLGVHRAALTDFAPPEADVVVAAAPCLEHRGGRLGPALDGLLRACEEALSRGLGMTVELDALELAVPVHATLRAAGLPVSPQGLVARLGLAAGKKGVRLVMASGRAPAEGGRLAVLDSGLGGPRSRPPDLTVAVRHWAGVEEVVDAAHKAHARTLWLLGASAAAAHLVRQRLAPHVDLVRAAGARQMSLEVAGPTV